MMEPAISNIHVGDELPVSVFMLSHLISKAHPNKVNVWRALQQAILENESGSSRMNLQCGSPDSVALDSADKKRLFGLMNLSCW